MSRRAGLSGMRVRWRLAVRVDLADTAGVVAPGAIRDRREDWTPLASAIVPRLLGWPHAELVLGDPRIVWESDGCTVYVGWWVPGPVARWLVAQAAADVDIRSTVHTRRLLTVTAP